MFCDFPKYRQVKSTIYRGVGGGGDATSDVELNALITLSTTATDAAIAAQAAQTAATTQAGIATTQAGNASASASTAAASAALAQALAGTAPSQTGNAGKYLTTDGTATSWGVVTSNPGTVTSVAATVPSFLSVAGSPITSSGTLAISLSGTALPVANGGTGATTSTGSGDNVLSTSPTLTTPSINSAQVATVSGTAPLYMCRAWVNFNGTGTVAIRASGNVSSITDNGTGNYTVNFATALPDAGYSAQCSVGSGSGVSAYIYNTFYTAAPTASAFRFLTVSLAGVDTDYAYVMATVTR
jgi:hypothetical protein